MAKTEEFHIDQETGELRTNKELFRQEKSK